MPPVCLALADELKLWVVRSARRYVSLPENLLGSNLTQRAMSGHQQTT
jgi:hypothetical protein